MIWKGSGEDRPVDCADQIEVPTFLGQELYSGNSAGCIHRRTCGTELVPPVDLPGPRTALNGLSATQIYIRDRKLGRKISRKHVSCIS